MELAVGIGYFVVLLATMVVVYGFIKLIPYVLAVSATFVLFQWVFTSLALPSAGHDRSELQQRRRIPTWRPGRQVLVL